MVDKALHSGTIHTLVQCARATAHVRPWAHSCLLFGPFGCSSAEALKLLARFGSVTVLNGHIHQLMQKVEGM
jgi:hypothetical protein